MPCAVHLLEARLQRGVERKVLLSEAEGWIERSGRSHAVLDAMARFVLGSRLTEAVAQAERWAREGGRRTHRGAFPRLWHLYWGRTGSGRTRCRPSGRLRTQRPPPRRLGGG
jgi:hypothetical protein